MNDPFNRDAQPLTDALLQLDRAISVAEANVLAAQQVGLPEAPALAANLPNLTLRARQFLANVPDMTQPQRWGEARRLFDQARSFGPAFAPYIALGARVAAVKQAASEQAARARAAAEAARRAQHERDALQSMDLARKRLSALRQTYAEMQMLRGAGFDDQQWQDSLRAVGSIVTAQDVRLSAAAGSVRDFDFDQAQAQLDQALGELQAGLDLAQRARVAAERRAQQAAPLETSAKTIRMPDLSGRVQAPSILIMTDGSAQPDGGAPAAPVVSTATTLSLIETRSGIVFRCDGRSTVLGRGLDPGGVPPEVYLDLSRACDPGESEELGVSRRHAEIAKLATGFSVRDLGSTNGTRLRRIGQSTWQILPEQQWTTLAEGDSLQFGLLECGVRLN